jgi:hypothetical protein
MSALAFRRRRGRPPRRQRFLVPADTGGGLLTTCSWSSSSGRTWPVTDRRWWCGRRQGASTTSGPGAARRQPRRARRGAAPILELPRRPGRPPGPSLAAVAAAVPLTTSGLARRGRDRLATATRASLARRNCEVGHPAVIGSARSAVDERSPRAWAERPTSAAHDLLDGAQVTGHFGERCRSVASGDGCCKTSVTMRTERHVPSGNPGPAPATPTLVASQAAPPAGRCGGLISLPSISAGLREPTPPPPSRRSASRPQISDRLDALDIELSEARRAGQRGPARARRQRGADRRRRGPGVGRKASSRCRGRDALRAIDAYVGGNRSPPRSS